jgi:hypothetical protein
MTVAIFDPEAREEFLSAIHMQSYRESENERALVDKGLRQLAFDV